MSAKAKQETPSMKTVRTFFKVGTCSEALFNVLNRAYDHPLEPEENAAMPLAGGIMLRGHQCGLVWGAALGAGAEAHARFGLGPRAETAAILAAQRVTQAFHTRNGAIDCVALTGLDKSSGVM